MKEMFKKSITFQFQKFTFNFFLVSRSIMKESQEKEDFCLGQSGFSQKKVSGVFGLDEQDLSLSCQGPTSHFPTHRPARGVQRVGWQTVLRAHALGHVSIAEPDSVSLDKAISVLQAWLPLFAFPLSKSLPEHSPWG